ncbi:MAG: ABC transporter permease, partial [Ktedonobacterales bacterium]
ATDVDGVVRSTASQELHTFTAGPAEYIEPDGYLNLMTIDGKRPTLVDTQLGAGGEMSLFAFNYAQAAPHMRILAGRLPHDTAPGALPEVMVTPKLGLAPGHTLQLQESTYLKGTITAEVVGVWFPKDPNDPFWNGRSYDTYFSPNPGGPPPIYPVLLTRAALLDNLSFPVTSQRFFDVQPLGMILHYIYFTQPTQITISTMGDVASHIQSLRSDLNGNLIGSFSVGEVNVNTQLDTLVGGLSQQFSLFALPLYVIVAQIVGLALLFIIVMTGLLVEGQATELATLRSRGASGFQLLGTYLLQGLALGAIALVLGPLLAAAASVTLARFFVPDAQSGGVVSAGYLAQVATPAVVALPALAGVVLGVGALLVAAYSAARRDSLSIRQERGRTLHAPLWRRLYLDVALAVICAAGYVQLTYFGGTDVRTQLSQTGQGGSAAPDPLLLLTPGLLLLAGALLLLRLFPLVARMGMWLALRRRGATDVLAFAQLTRAGAAASRLALALTVAVGLGFFALTYQSSLAQSAQDRAAYLAGSDQRVVINQEAEGATITTGFTTRLAQAPGVQAVSPVFRSAGDVLLAGGATPSVTIMAIEPQSFASVADWRSNDASQSLHALMQGMIAHEYKGSSGQASSPYANTAGTATAGTERAPIYTLMSAGLASSLNLHPGDRFHATPREGASTYTFVLGAIVNNFPTLYTGNQVGYVVVDAHDYIPALENPALDGVFVNGPDEFWLRTTPDARAAQARAHLLQDPNLLVQNVLDRRQLAAQFQVDPIAAGMTGLLLMGALLAVSFAIVSCAAQAIVWVRQRRTQITILRTLGLSGGELARVTLAELGSIVLFSLVGGGALGLLLASATLPFLQFSATLLDTTTLGGPASTLALNPTGILAFYAALLVAFGLTLLLVAGITRRISLSSTLRLGED